MNFRLKAALGAGLLIFSAGAASAATATAVTALNVRSGPGGSYPVVDTMPEGETVNVVGCQAGWCEISMGRDGTGFASESYLDLAGRPARSSVVIEESEPTVITGLSIGGYWGESPYYYDDGFYYYGGRWYGERPGRPGWERSWSRDHHRGGDFGGGGPRPGWGDRDRPGRPDFGGGRDRPDRDDRAGRGGRDFGARDSGARDSGERGRDRGDRDRGEDRRGAGGRGGGGGRSEARVDAQGEGGRGRGGSERSERSGDRGDRVGLDRAR